MLTAPKTYSNPSKISNAAMTGSTSLWKKLLYVLRGLETLGKVVSSTEPVTLTKHVVYDPEQGVIIVKQDTHIHFTDQIKITSDKDVIIKSGRKDNPDRPGYRYSIWQNSDEDELRRPIMKGWLENNSGELELVELKFDAVGCVIIPDGYKNPAYSCGCEHK